MKYIEAEKLKAEIERRLKSLHEWKIGWERRLPLSRNKTYYKNFGKESAYDAILNIITSLQQEQPEADLEEEAYMRGFAQGAKEEREDLIPLINRLCEAILFEWKDAADLARETLTQIKAREE